MNNSRTNAHVITGVGIFTAVVIVLQLLGAFIRFGPFSISLTLIPIVVGAVFKALEKTNVWVAAVCAAITCPVVNTGLFLVGCRLFFMETIAGWGAAMGFESVGKYMIYGLVGGNFVFELLTNIVLSPVIVRLIRIGRKEKT